MAKQGSQPLSIALHSPLDPAWGNLPASPPDRLASSIPLPGLFRLPDGGAATVGVDDAGRWHIAGTHRVVDDVLTAVYLYTFGGEPFKRLVVARPASLGLTMLRQDPGRARGLLREFPPQHALYSFGVSPAAEWVLRPIVEARQVAYAEVDRRWRVGAAPGDILRGVCVNLREIVERFGGVAAPGDVFSAEEHRPGLRPPTAA